VSTTIMLSDLGVGEKERVKSTPWIWL